MIISWPKEGFTPNYLDDSEAEYFIESIIGTPLAYEGVNIGEITHATENHIFARIDEEKVIIKIINETTKKTGIQFTIEKGGKNMK